MKEINNFLIKSNEVLNKVDKKIISKSLQILKKCQKRNGRIFFAGSGGGAGHASHAANDFRKICNIESYSITDNVSELTARINDDGWNSSYSNWLKISKVKKEVLANKLFNIIKNQISKSKINIENITRDYYAKEFLVTQLRWFLKMSIIYYYDKIEYMSWNPNYDNFEILKLKKKI